MPISVWGVSSRAIDVYIPGETAKLTKGGEITLREDGYYRMISEEPFTGESWYENICNSNHGSRIYSE